MSAATYRIVGHSRSNSVTPNMITMDALTPGSYYTFIVWAVGSGKLVSNNITCSDSTGLSDEFLLSIFSLSFFSFACFHGISKSLRLINI